MKDWQTPKPGDPVHPDSVRNQDKPEKTSILPLLYFCAGIAALVVAVPLVQEAFYYLNPEALAAAQKERAAIKAAQEEAERLKTEAERQARQQESARADREARENRAVNVCEAAIRAGARVPRSVSFHTFGLDFSTRADGSILVAQDFDAINGYGQKTTNEGRCLVSAGGQLLEFYFNGNRMH